MAESNIYMLSKRNNTMIDSERDYSEEIANICRQHHVIYLGLHGSGPNQENDNPEDLEIDFLVKFESLEPKQHAMCYFALEKELEKMFARNVGLCDISKITHPVLLRQLTKNKTDIYKA